ncbi:unnamed protein product [Allacma fusca]|uniref:Uncharacterized protein n=1 Tax=Allacma fusca TaxID=39272 RepID=A0A8J2NWE0_9HEXA|nr:unnamed protein product [Allacma fusca]
MQDASESQNVHEDLDSAFLELYFQNNRLVDFQSKCIFEDSPCDIVGRWLKPRLAAGLQGATCQPCSLRQSDALRTILTHLKKSRPDFYEKALITYLTNRELLDLLTKEFLGHGQSPTSKTFNKAHPTSAPPVSPPTPPVPLDTDEILKSESSIERRHVVAPNIYENFIPGKPSKTLIDTSIIDIFILPRSSHSFSIPILTKQALY